MSYYCFLCNENHDDSPTKEHFIPRSIDGPEHQWLPVCEASNKRSNVVFDNYVRDILYLVRFKSTRDLKRLGLALLSDGSYKPIKFSYVDKLVLEGKTAFNYIFDRETNQHVPNQDVSAIVFPVGLMPDEQKTFCRGLAKISIGAIAYRLIEEGVAHKTIKQVFSQPSVNALHRIALGLPLSGKMEMKFSLGRSDVLEKLHYSCKNQQVRNHVVKICFQKKNKIHVEGLLYSHCGWRLEFTNRISIEYPELRLENRIEYMNAPEKLEDRTLSLDSICVGNPNFTGPKRDAPLNWRTLLNTKLPNE